MNFNANTFGLATQSSEQVQRGLFKTFAITLFVMAVLTMLPTAAHAQANTGWNLPVVDQFVCGFLVYARSKLAPIIAAGVIILSIIGHWLGAGKMWSTLMYVGIGLGVILGIFTMLGQYASLPASCV